MKIYLLKNKSCISKSKIQKERYKSLDARLTQSSVPVLPRRSHAHSVTKTGPQSLQPESLNFARVCIDLLRSGKRIRFRAPGYSMYPTILNGDEITVEPMKPDAIKVGDIILYRYQENLIAHRVVQIENKCDTQSSVLRTQSYFTLRGDARPACDDPVEAKQILGKVVSIETNGRSVNPYGFKGRLIFNLRRWVLCLRVWLIYSEFQGTFRLGACRCGVRVRRGGG